MFEDAMVESSGRLNAKTGRWMWLTATLNLFSVAVMVAVPLIYPEALPRTALTAVLAAPPPPPAAPRAVPVQPRVERQHVAVMDPFTAPSRVPRTIDRTREEPPAAAVAGMPDMGSAQGVGPGSALTSALGLGVAPVPVARVVPVKPTGPARISSGVMAGQVLVKAQPMYPAIAKAAHVSGAVVLRAMISRDGTVQRLIVVSGHEMLRASAVAAVQQWRYRPYLLNGEPTEVDTEITVNFTFGG